MTNDNDNVVNIFDRKPVPQGTSSDENLVPEEKRKELLDVLDDYVKRIKEGRISMILVCAFGPLEKGLVNGTRYSIVSSRGDPSHPMIGCVEAAKFDLLDSFCIELDDPDTPQ